MGNTGPTCAHTSATGTARPETARTPAICWKASTLSLLRDSERGPWAADPLQPADNTQGMPSLGVRESEGPEDSRLSGLRFLDLL